VMVLQVSSGRHRLAVKILLEATNNFVAGFEVFMVLCVCV
jgi:hypothetical protein